MRSENFAVQKKPEIRAKFLNNPKFGLLRELAYYILVRGHPNYSALFYKSLSSKFEFKEPSYLTHTSGITYCGLDLSLMLVNGISYEHYY